MKDPLGRTAAALPPAGTAWAAVLLAAAAWDLPAQAPAKPAEADAAAPRWIADRDRWRSLSPTQRVEARRRAEKEVLDRALAKVEKPWRTKQASWALVISDADQRTVGSVTKATEQFFAWCHDQFGDVNDEMVRRRVLRIWFVEDPADKTTHLPGDIYRGLTLDPDRELELRLHKASTDRPTMFTRLFSDILDAYLMDKDPLLFRYQPGWMAAGQAFCADAATLVNNRLKFRSSERERNALIGLVRKGEARTLRQILTMPEADVRRAFTGDHRFEFARALRFFTTGPGAKQKLTKSFVRDYLAAVIAAVEHLRPEWSPIPATGNVRIEGKLQWVSPAVLAQWNERRDAVNARVFDSVCGRWTGREWQQLEKAFAAYRPQ